MERYRLAELATISGVTPRTIRYYIAEGLLPPPLGAGPAAAYTAAHRDRLALIALLKGRAVPLRAITERLAGMSDDAVQTELARTAAPSLASGQATAAAPSVVAPPNRTPVGEVWQRVALADGVELHVRADRLREPVPLDALVRQARRLLGEE